MNLYVKKCWYSKENCSSPMFMGKETVTRLYDESFHEWKIIPIRLIKNAFGNSFRFHSNLASKRYVKSFPYYYRYILYMIYYIHYYRDILLNWKRYLSQKSDVPSCILSQNWWYNQYIQMDIEPVHLVKFSV